MQESPGGAIWVYDYSLVMVNLYLKNIIFIKNYNLDFLILYSQLQVY